MAGFKKASRAGTALKIALMGVPGSGKTEGALRLATGLVSRSGKRIAMIDTERGSGSLYCDRFDYDVLDIAPPFEPKKFTQAIDDAGKAGYGVLIIDSLSHAWAGEGGMLDLHGKAEKAVRNGFAAWREVTPQHNKLVDGILQSPCHVICTMRSKIAYEIVKEGGRTAVQKIGLAPIQREGLEYEFTLVFDMSVDGHVATATKDRTHIFDGTHVVLTSGDGVKLLDWLETGSPSVLPQPAKPAATAADDDEELGKWASEIAACQTESDLAKLWATRNADITGSAQYDAIKALFSQAKEVLRAAA